MSVLDRPTERHTGPEPRVLTSDVKAVIELAIDPANESSNRTVEFVAEQSNVSTRTVYRVLQEHTDSISMRLADILCLSSGSRVQRCRLVWPNGEVTSYYG